jgi:hypothetical protein
MTSPLGPPVDKARQRRQLNLRLRLAWLAGVEDRSRRENGRGLTDEELREALRRYPGDLPER